MSNVESNTFRSVLAGRSAQAASVGAAVGAGVGVTQDQYAMERLNNSIAGLANPPFAIAPDRNKLITIGDSRVLRGYIRRSDTDGSDDSSRHRLYFMYNPEVINRSYLSYLDQQALDPYNAEGSNNMAATPALLDFTFELLFDRHLEVARDENHPGTKVDLDYFDLVVRGVVPDVPNDGNAIPDNGIMMVNPRNVAVIFGPELAVHGRPYNAAIRFEKFSHRMTTTRMTIAITMKAFYIGPVSSIPGPSTYSDEAAYTATIPYDESVVYSASYEDLNPVELRLTTETSGFAAVYNTGGAGVAGGTVPNPGSIPTGGQRLTPDQMADLVVSAGLRGDRAAIAISIAYRESGFNPRAHNRNPATNDDSVGLFQINFLVQGFKDKYGPYERMFNPLNAMAAFMDLSKSGTNFTPWYVNQDGSPRVRGYDLKFLPQARALVRARNAY